MSEGDYKSNDIPESIDLNGAIDEVNKSGDFMDGSSKLIAVRADSTCVDAAAAQAAAATYPPAAYMAPVAAGVGFAGQPAVPVVHRRALPGRPRP